MRDCCPVCRKPVAAKAAAHPFCSPRCRLVDLGRWLDGQYRIPDPDPLPEDLQAATEPDGDVPDEHLH